jgi:hypothetical protein
MAAFFEKQSLAGDLALIGGIVSSLLTIVLYIYWAFQARAAIKTYALNTFRVDLKINAFYTFVLTCFYINYCINDLPDAVRRQDILMSRRGGSNGTEVPG